MRKTPVAQTIAYRSVADRVRCARYFTEVLCEFSDDSTLWRSHASVIRKYVNAQNRHVALVRELFCQTPTSPLYELATLWDQVENEHKCNENGTMLLFMNLRTVLEHCVLENASDPRVSYVFFSSELNAKLRAMGVVGTGSAAVFLMNFTYDSQFRTSVVMMWTNDDVLSTLFSHGLDLNRYVDCSSVFGRFSDDLFWNDIQLQNDFASALDLLIGTYDALHFFYTNTKVKTDFARVLFDDDSSMAKRWCLLHPCVKYFPTKVKTLLLEYSKNSSNTDPMTWITFCRVQAYIHDSHVVRVNDGGNKHYARVCFFENYAREKNVFDDEKCHLDFRCISFPNREKVKCARCHKVVAAYKSTQANGLFFCSIVDERKRADNLDNISVCAGSATSECPVETDDILAIMHPAVNASSPREFVVEIMRKTFAGDQADAWFGTNQYFFRLYHAMTKHLFSQKAELPITFKDRIISVLPTEYNDTYESIRDIFSFYARVEFFCRVAFANGQDLRQLRSRRANQFQDVACRMVRFVHDDASDSETTVEKDDFGLLRIAHRGRFFSPGLGALFALTQNVPLGFGRHDQRVNEAVVLFVARKKILHAMFASLTWRCVASELLQNARAKMHRQNKLRNRCFERFKHNASAMDARRVRLLAVLTRFVESRARCLAFKKWLDRTRDSRRDARERESAVKRKSFARWKVALAEAKNVRRMDRACDKIVRYKLQIQAYRIVKSWRSIVALNALTRKKENARMRWYKSCHAIRFYQYLQKLRKRAWWLDYYDHVKKCKKRMTRKRWNKIRHAINFFNYLQRLRRAAWLLDFHEQLRSYHEQKLRTVEWQREFHERLRLYHEHLMLYQRRLL